MLWSKKSNIFLSDAFEWNQKYVGKVYLSGELQEILQLHFISVCNVITV